MKIYKKVLFLLLFIPCFSFATVTITPNTLTLPGSFNVTCNLSFVVAFDQNNVEYLAFIDGSPVSYTPCPTNGIIFPPGVYTFYECNFCFTGDSGLNTGDRKLLEILATTTSPTNSTTTVTIMATTTDPILKSISFQIEILIVIIFVLVSGFIWNRFHKKKAWK